MSGRLAAWIRILPGRLSVRIRKLPVSQSRRVDFLQMYGVRYGTCPVVAAVGGLADTVVNANPAALATGVATGITFHPTDAPAFAEALRRLVALHADSKTWAQIVKRAMAQPVGWDASAAVYARLYESILRT